MVKSLAYVFIFFTEWIVTLQLLLLNCNKPIIEQKIPDPNISSHLFIDWAMHIKSVDS